MFDEPPLKKRPTWKADTTVEPYEKLSGSTSVRWLLAGSVYGSLLSGMAVWLADRAAGRGTGLSPSRPQEIVVWPWTNHVPVLGR